MEDIGVGTKALHCITDKVQCCRERDGGAIGEWYQPGQTNNPVDGNGRISTEDFSRNRGPSAVLLNRRNAATSPTGLYHCEVPDSGDVIQSLYIRVYNASELQTMMVGEIHGSTDKTSPSPSPSPSLEPLCSAIVFSHCGLKPLCSETERVVCHF